MAWIDEHPIGNVLPSSRTVAEGANVSQKTAVRALNQLSHDGSVPRASLDGKVRKLPKAKVAPPQPRPGDRRANLYDPFMPPPPRAIGREAYFVWQSLRKFKLRLLGIEPAKVLAAMNSEMFRETCALAPVVSMWLAQLGKKANGRRLALERETAAAGMARRSQVSETETFADKSTQEDEAEFTAAAGELLRKFGTIGSWEQAVFLFEKAWRAYGEDRRLVRDGDRFVIADGELEREGVR
jgi:hypothetical protein